MITTIDEPISGKKGHSRAVDPTAVLSILEWLSGDECHAIDEAGLIAGLGKRLRQIGLPVDRLTLHLTTLHPEILGRTLAWAPAEPIEIHEREHSTMMAYTASPLRKAMESREPMIFNADDRTWQWRNIDVFENRQLTQIMIAPLCNDDGPVSAAMFGTRRTSGFNWQEVEAIERILPALRNTCEMRALRQAELSLLDVYIGPITAQRILAGRIRQGEVETMEAALLLCHLRGFTRLSNRLPSSKVIQLLNAYFDIVTPVIAGQGGEVLKFMGDAVLAFFPASNAILASEQALTAAGRILNELSRFEQDGIRLEAGIALHYGQVSYGNIGSGRRFGLTVIGPDVNLLSRIQKTCDSLGKSILMSDIFRQKSGAEGAVSAKFQALEDFETPVELFTIPMDEPSVRRATMDPLKERRDVEANQARA
ncbi:adenylate/guanylate cyclase domain-containing protein [Neorhizobium sp. NCHU2750]|uniref:adenylate/guanylate cyclase domain-containing protein n=1 Tax=Neorhizobium sp. NCHU2750 TaxID=1825976 RepID=UPI000E72C012|nr:adenylate cyclase [Neorhizobium sp. NCHU2750]